MHSLSPSLTVLPPDLFRPLTALKTLKINHNSLTKLPASLGFLSSLQTLHAHDNKVESLNRNLFKVKKTTNVSVVLFYLFVKVYKIINAWF